MQPPLRSKQEVIINAPLGAVWSFSMDLTKIPDFHPRVFKVDLLDGKAFREPGVSYQCHLSGGKHTCIEKDIEIIPVLRKNSMDDIDPSFECSAFAVCPLVFHSSGPRCEVASSSTQSSSV